MLADDNAQGLQMLRRSTHLRRSSSRKQKKLTVFLNTTNSSRMTTCVLVCGSINASKLLVHKHLLAKLEEKHLLAKLVHKHLLAILVHTHLLAKLVHTFASKISDTHLLANFVYANVCGPFESAKVECMSKICEQNSTSAIASFPIRMCGPNVCDRPILALLPTDVWEALEQVFLKFEAYQLRGQTAPKKKPTKPPSPGFKVFTKLFASATMKEAKQVLTLVINGKLAVKDIVAHAQVHSFSWLPCRCPATD